MSVQWQQPYQPLGGRARNRRQLQRCLLEVVVAPRVRIASRRIPQIPALLKAGRCFVCLRKGHISRVSSVRSVAASTTSAFAHGTQSIATLLRLRRHNQPTPQESIHRVPRLPRRERNHPRRNPHSMQMRLPSHLVKVAQPHRCGLAQIVQYTAQAQAFKPDVPQRRRQVRIVLDCGSQRSYVTEQVARELALNPKGEQSLTIMTFGSSAEQSRVCTFTKLNLVLSDGETQTLTLFAVPLICEPLVCHPVSFCQESFDHLNGLHLADPTDGSSHPDVDILIGSDQ